MRMSSYQYSNSHYKNKMVDPCYLMHPSDVIMAVIMGLSNHQPHHWLPNRLLRCRSKKTSQLRVTGLCAGNSPVNSPHKWPVTWKMFPFDDVIMGNPYPGRTVSLSGMPPLNRWKRNMGQEYVNGCVWNFHCHSDCLAALNTYHGIHDDLTGSKTIRVVSHNLQVVSFHRPVDCMFKCLSKLKRWTI